MRNNSRSSFSKTLQQFFIRIGGEQESGNRKLVSGSKLNRQAKESAEMFSSTGCDLSGAKKEPGIWSIPGSVCVSSAYSRVGACARFSLGRCGWNRAPSGGTGHWEWNRVKSPSWSSIAKGSRIGKIAGAGTFQNRVSGYRVIVARAPVARCVQMNARLRGVVNDVVGDDIAVRANINGIKRRCAKDFIGGNGDAISNARRCP